MVRRKTQRENNPWDPRVIREDWQASGESLNGHLDEADPSEHSERRTGFGLLAGETFCGGTEQGESKRKEQQGLGLHRL